jgi:hypothetical protein
MLGEKNKYFKMAYNRVFKRSVKSYDGSMQWRLVTFLAGWADILMLLLHFLLCLL